MAEFCDYVNHPLFGACWDTGHANCEGHQYEDIIAMGDRLKAIHFNDNRGEKDEHLMPFMGTMSMDDIMHGLLDMGFKGYFTLECDAMLKNGNGWPYKRRPSTRDSRLFDIPIEIFRLQEKVLFESTDRNGMMEGYTGNYIRISRPYDAELIGKIADITI